MDYSRSLKVCLEGPSAIGKSSISKVLDPEFRRIPEVNELFKDEINEGGFWYYRKQVERYQLGVHYGRCIFDGDLFQPLWYNWTYQFPREYLPIEKIKQFYKSEIIKGNIKFPDLYILLQTSVENLTKRKESDETRSRSNFLKHLKLVESQPKYFGYMKQCFPQLVQIISYPSVIQVEKNIRKAIDQRNMDVCYDDLEILDTMTEWLYTHVP